jgi:hypothetical protein
LSLALPGKSASPAGIPDGYWAWTENPDDEYERYIRVTGDSGFYCFLDRKSSFPFAIVGDSITTPMNGMDAIRLFPESGDLQITGVEKGEDYVDLFHPSDAATYAGKCGEEDPAVKGSTAARERSSRERTGNPKLRIRRQATSRDMLGRLVRPGP